MLMRFPFQITNFLLIHLKTKAAKMKMIIDFRNCHFKSFPVLLIILMKKVNGLMIEILILVDWMKPKKKAGQLLI